MCGRYSIAGPSPAELRGRFALGDEVELRPRWNVAPTDAVPCVTAAADGAPRGELLRWGLVPPWSRDARGAARMINARAETVAAKPAFRDAFRRKRCLVVADGFYEWERRPDGVRRAHLITRRDGAPFAFAGLAASWRGGLDPDEVLRTCAIVTTRANADLAGLHDRMPVLLEAEAEEAWLDPATSEGTLRELLAPLPDGALALREVGPAVNRVAEDSPACQAPPAEVDGPPPTLF